jgi:hypothetical protein
MGGEHNAPAALPPGKTRFPLYRRLGGHGAGLDVSENSRSHRGFLLFQIQVTNFSFLLYSLYKPLQETQSYAGL